EPALVCAAVCRDEVSERHGIKVVVREEDESKAFTAERHDLTDDCTDIALTRLLTIRSPHRTERTVLRATANRLHGSPHVAIGGQQVPPSGRERLAFDATAFVLGLEMSGFTISQHAGPDDVAVSGHDGIGGTALTHFVREERGVDAAKHDDRPACVR